jgi:phage terminase small subunit
MPAPRKPTNVLALKGSFKHDPQRARARSDEPKPTEPIGEPPAHLNEEAAACWREIVATSHPGVLSVHDRLIVEEGANLLAWLRRSGWLTDPAFLVRWERFLGCLGMTPADRSRVSIRSAEEDKPKTGLASFR